MGLTRRLIRGTMLGIVMCHLAREHFSSRNTMATTSVHATGGSCAHTAKFVPNNMTIDNYEKNMFVNRNIIFSADGQLMDTGNDENPYKLTRLSFSGSSGFQPSSGKNAQSILPLQTGLITPSAKNMLKLGIPKSKWGNHAFQTDSRCKPQFISLGKCDLLEPASGHGKNCTCIKSVGFHKWCAAL